MMEEPLIEVLNNDGNALIKSMEHIRGETEATLWLDLAEEILYKSAKINVLARELLYKRQIPYYYILKKTADDLHIKIRMRHQFLYMRMPPVPTLSSSNYQHSNCYRKFLNEALDLECRQYFSSFIKERGEKYERCSVLCCQRYKEAATEADFDNLDMTPILNVLKRYFMLDDNGRYCHVHFIAKEAEQPAMEIYLADQKDFMKLYEMVMGGCNEGRNNKG